MDYFGLWEEKLSFPWRSVNFWRVFAAESVKCFVGAEAFKSVLKGESVGKRSVDELT